MRWYDVFIKGMKEQIRDYWILVMTVVLAPLFIAIYFLMVETETPKYDIILVNQDKGIVQDGQQINLGDSLLFYGELVSGSSGMSMLQYQTELNREKAIEMLRNIQADVLVVFPENLSASVLDTTGLNTNIAQIEIMGDITQMEYIIGAVWTEELFNSFVLGTAKRPPWDIRVSVQCLSSMSPDF